MRGSARSHRGSVREGPREASRARESSPSNAEAQASSHLGTSRERCARSRDRHRAATHFSGNVVSRSDATRSGCEGEHAFESRVVAALGDWAPERAHARGRALDRRGATRRLRLGQDAQARHRPQVGALRRRGLLRQRVHRRVGLVRARGCRPSARTCRSASIRAAAAASRRDAQGPRTRAGRSDHQLRARERSA